MDGWLWFVELINARFIYSMLKEISWCLISPYKKSQKMVDLVNGFESQS
jgi:hypothetical protein